MAKIEIIITDANGNVMSVFDVTEVDDDGDGDITDIELVDEIKDKLSDWFCITDK